MGTQRIPRQRTGKHVHKEYRRVRLARRTAEWRRLKRLGTRAELNAIAERVESEGKSEP